ncbi:MAG: Transcriptional regulator, GntR family [Escherichia coli DORA_A_5_14_21]|uniref:Transcriptional regulator, GntR family n=1 Tax=Escherichia coli DORA_A_5_14_21 TaxID=1403943 RepID=W1XB99_ECOLX|nr:MAG: Transcriptional regulator, GntR family [Escherichia coli DORA_A_5_14_21]
MTITSLDGYRWLKNDIIRGNFQPDEKLRMSLLTSRYALGVGPLREALSQLVAERLVTVVNQTNPPTACKILTALITQIIINIAVMEGEEGFSPKPKTNIATPNPPPAPSPIPPYFPPIPIQARTINSCIKNRASIFQPQRYSRI